MKLTLGTTLDGQAIDYDPSQAGLLVLFGDPGRGKTTLARFITRWWTADPARHAHLFTTATEEWADHHRSDRGSPAHRRASAEIRIQRSQEQPEGCRPETCLVVIDDIPADVLESLPRLKHLRQSTSTWVVTSTGQADIPASRPQDVAATNIVRLGLLPHEAGALSDRRPRVRRAAASDGLQGRLDWPPDTVPFIPSFRGPVDFPCHHWQQDPISEIATLRLGAGRVPRLKVAQHRAGRAGGAWRSAS